MKKPESIPRIPTERLVLRPLVDDDAPALFEVYSSAEVSRYLLRPAMTSLQEAVDMVARNRRFAAEGSGYSWAMGLLPDERAIGNCSLFDFNEQSDRAEIGYVLGRAHWNRGLMHEALTALIDYGFGEMGLRRLEADLDPRNTASERSLARLGFAREGLLRERWVVTGEVSDTLLMGLLAREWAERRAGS